MEIQVYATEDVARVDSALRALSPKIAKGLPGFGGLKPQELTKEHALFPTFFGGECPPRARTMVEPSRIRIAIDTTRVQSDSSLVGLLSHETSHVLQVIARGPLHFPTWTWMLDLDHYVRRVHALLQALVDRAGMNSRTRPEDPNFRVVARNYMKAFMDVDVHAFMMAEEILDPLAYGELIEDFIENRGGRNSITVASMRADLDRQRVGRPEYAVRLTSGVFMDWFDIVGGRWGKLGPLLELPHSDQLVSKYVLAERALYDSKLGKLYEEGLLDKGWRDLQAAGGDVTRIWKILQRLSTDALAAVRAQM